ncbi:MAG TPA: DUF3108 domain-containing protein [Casimicrobiaceae bacterium]|nr:DUF3108 domain-containing protein [Casimicrobiaceae bacterium]
MNGETAPPRLQRPWWHARRPLALALAASLAVHLALTSIPDELPKTPDSTPLTARLTELPPPPAPTVATPQVKPKPKPRPRPSAPVVKPEPPVEVAAAAEASAGPVADAPPAAEPPAEAASEPRKPPILAEDVDVPAAPVIERKTLPPRVDLAFKVFYGTQGFQIGQATYRFEHADNRYRIAIVGDARGLAALLFRGQGRIESRGAITPEGLQPHELVVDKFNRRGSERADLDWENGIVNLHNEKTEAIEPPTFDLLSLMWQYYFRPPEDDVQTFTLATTRRVFKITATRKRRETIEWANGTIETEVWHRVSDDGRSHGYAWIAPSLRWLPVKMRAETPRGTVEVLLDSIRVDEAHASVQTTE